MQFLVGWMRMDVDQILITGNISFSGRQQKLSTEVSFSGELSGLASLVPLVPRKHNSISTIEKC
jgi:hypothetical protein